MKKVAVIGVHVVGMHHWGGRELRLAKYILPETSLEILNAVAVYEDTECIIKRPYLCREDALIVSKFFDENLLCGICFLETKRGCRKIQETPWSLQRCNVGFFSAEENIIRIREILHRYELKVW